MIAPDFTAYTRNPIFIVFRMFLVEVQTTTATTLPILFSNLILIFYQPFGSLFCSAFLGLFELVICFCCCFGFSLLLSFLFLFITNGFFFSLFQFRLISLFRCQDKVLVCSFLRLPVFGTTAGYCRISLSPSPGNDELLNGNIGAFNAGDVMV